MPCEHLYPFHSPSALKTQAWHIPPYPLSLLPIIKHTKNLHASVIGLASRLVTCRLRPHLPGIHLNSLAISATSHRCLNRNRGVALYCTAHHGNCAAACAGHKETVGSRRDNVYVLPSTSMALYRLVSSSAPSRPMLTHPSVSDHPQYGRNWCVLPIGCCNPSHIITWPKVVIKATRRFRHMVSVCARRLLPTSAAQIEAPSSRLSITAGRCRCLVLV